MVVPVEFAMEEGAGGAVVGLAIDAGAAVETAVVLAVEVVIFFGDAVGEGKGNRVNSLLHEFCIVSDDCRSAVEG